MLNKINYWISISFFSISILLALSFTFLNNSYFDYLFLILVILLMTLGLSHGSLDNLKGYTILNYYNIKHKSLFYIVYISMSFFSFLFWNISSQLFVLFFIVISSFHFGKDDAFLMPLKNNQLKYVFYILRGLIIIIAPFSFNFNNTIEIIKSLFITKNGFLVNQLVFMDTNRFFLTTLILCIIISYNQICKKIHKILFMLELFSIILINIIFTPFIAFSIYFCFLHSLRHYLSLSFDFNIKSLKDSYLLILKNMIPLTFFALLCVYIFSIKININFLENNDIVKLSFLSLAFLAIPHLLLECLFEFVNTKKLNL